MNAEQIETFTNTLKLKPIDSTKSYKTLQPFECQLCKCIYDCIPKNRMSQYRVNTTIGCPDCSKKNRDAAFDKTTREKIEQNFTILSKHDYLKIKDKVTVRNNDCGHEFSTVVSNIIHSDVNCPVCARKAQAQRGWHRADGSVIKKERIYNTLDIRNRVEELNSRHPDRKLHLVEPFVYSTMNDRIKFTCDNGHEFKTTLYNILSPSTESGCMQCARIQASINNRRSIDEIKADIFKTQGDTYQYPYLEEEYKNANSIITIVCKKHGEFKQSLFSHYYSGHQCPSCASVKYSMKALTWLDLQAKLDNVHIQHAANGGEYKIPNTKYHADGYCEATNTIYEFHGSYFHGDPEIFQPDEIVSYGKLAGDCYAATLLKEQILRELGYNLQVIWEREWDALNIPTTHYIIPEDVKVND